MFKSFIVEILNICKARVEFAKFCCHARINLIHRFFEDFFNIRWRQAIAFFAYQILLDAGGAQIGIT